MSYRRPLQILAAATAAFVAAPIGAQTEATISPQQRLAREIYKELVEIDTTATGDTARAADAMAARLRGAGFSKEDVRVFKPAPRKGNLIARLHGTGDRRPILLLAHLDVVGARREDWTTDPFKLVEQDGYFYARGSSDDKFMAASFVASLIRFKREGVRLGRDVVLVLETDEEVLDRDGVGIQWLLKNQRALFGDVEFAINEGGTIGAVKGRPAFVGVQVAEKLTANFSLVARNRGGHSSQPRKDNAIYAMATALTKLAKFEFPVELNDVSRASLQGAAALYPETIANDLKAAAAGAADPTVFARLSADPVINATMRTTCVATLLDAPGAYNALPQLVRANVNCRILPQQTVDQVLSTLRGVIDSDQVSVEFEWSNAVSSPSPRNDEFMNAVTGVSTELWHPVLVFPIMSPGASDGSYLRNAGIPTYGLGTVADLDDVRDHGRDERIYVRSFYSGYEFLYRLIERISK